MKLDINNEKAAACYFRFYNLFEKLTNEQKQLIFDLIKDMAPDKSICYYYIKKIMEDNNLEYSSLSNYIFSYMVFLYNTKKNNPEMIESDRNEINAKIQKLLITGNVTDKNIVIDIICDFFSISKDVIVTGYGKRYSINFEEVACILDKENTTLDDIISNSKDVLEYESDKIKSDFLYVIKHSDLLLAKLVQSKTGIKILPVTATEYSLIDKGAVAEYFELLKEKEQKAILHLMDNLTNTN